MGCDERFYLKERISREARMMFEMMMYFFGDRIIFKDDPYGLKQETIRYRQRMNYLQRTLRW